MTGITSSIARFIGAGDLTVSEGARRLGITREQFEERLSLMERQGYVARQDDAVFGECSCGHCCATCCKRDSTPAVVLYRLTGKGKRLAGIYGGT
jgi:hypothetical protein